MESDDGFQTKKKRKRAKKREKKQRKKARRAKREAASTAPRAPLPPPLDPRQRLLLTACAASDAEAVAQIVEQLGPALLLSARRPSSGRNALHVAAMAGSVDVCDALLRSELHAHIDARANDGSTALYLACAEEHAELCVWLLARGADASIVGARGCTPEDIGLSDLLERAPRRRVAPQAQRTTAGGDDDWAARLRAAAFLDQRDGGRAPSGFGADGGDGAIGGAWTAAAAALRARLREKRQRRAAAAAGTPPSAPAPSAAPRPAAPPAQPCAGAPPRPASAGARAAARSAPSLQTTPAALAAIRARDEAAWSAFVDAGSIVSLADVPWPSGSAANPMAFDFALSPAARKQALRALQRRWHPDKFQQRCSSRFASDAVRAAALARVTAVSQAINALR